MTPRLRIVEEAADEVEHERRWYRRRSVAAETSFLRELDHAVAAVVEAPNMWPRYIDGTQRYVFPTFPFSLVYFVDEDVLVVVAIAAEHKEPGYWRNRLSNRHT